MSLPFLSRVLQEFERLGGDPVTAKVLHGDRIDN